MTKAKRESSAAPADDSTADKVLAFRVPGGRDVRIESDLAWGVISELAAKHGVLWTQILAGPWTLLPGACLEDLFLACCEFAGVDPPAKLTGRAIVDAIQWVDSDDPLYVEDGLPTGGGQATT